MSISIKGLTHIYNKGAAFEKTALDNINLEIGDGEFIGLIGHTGSGKSTLIQHLNALLKPDEGQIFVNGEDINASKERLKALRCKVGLVFQYPEQQLFEMTVYDDVAFGPKNMGLKQDEIDQRVREALQSAGVAEELYKKSPFELSGGQKRRVAIAGVLAMKPDILVLDEPAAGLDPRGRDEILGQISEMHRSLGITVILVSHSMEDVARLVERIIVIRGGKIAMDGTPKEVFSRGAELTQLGLSSPQVTLLLDALREQGFDAPQGIYKIEDAVEYLFKQLKQVGNA